MRPDRNSVIAALAFAALWGVCLCAPAKCQEHGMKEEAHHEPHAHEMEGIELGLAAGYVDLIDEDEDALGLHVHLLKRLGGEGLRQYFGVGVGTEVIFADHEHYAAMVSLATFPWRDLVITFSPGIIWTEHDGDWESAYATHIEAAYVFPVGEHHIGPVVGYSWTDEEEHFMIGLHIGIHLGTSSH